MSRLSTCLAVATVMLLASLPVRAAEMIDNPQYISWSKHKPGTNVKLKQEIVAGPMTMTQEVTETLVEVTPEKAVVEMAMVMDFGGQKQEHKQKRDVAAKVEKGKENLPPDFSGSMKEVGSEKVEVAGKSYDCKVIEFTGEAQGNKATGKSWHSTEIPGGVAKTDMKMEGDMAGTMKRTVTAIETK